MTTEEQYIKKIQESFNKGVESAKPKWHYIADNDFPLEKKYYFVAVSAYSNTETWEDFVEFDTNTKEFEGYGKSSLGDEQVYAWCETPEIPKMKK